MKNFLFVSVLLLPAFMFAGPVLFNQSFDKDASGWTLNGKRGEWVADAGVDGSGALSISGNENGKGSSRWSSPALKFKAGGVYGIRFKARAANASGGTVTTGPEFCNVDIGIPGDAWKEYSYCFAVPSDLKDNQSVKFGQWECSGEFFFDDLEIFEVEPVYNRRNEIILGSGEVVDGNDYRFSGNFGEYSRNHSRNLEAANAGFNSQRWCIGAGQYVEYRHEIPGRKFTSATVSVDCGYYQKGTVQLFASRDAESWSLLGEVSALGTVSFKVPKPQLPAESLYIRFSGKNEGCNLQVYDYRLDAKFDGEPLSMHGYTRYVEKVRESANMPVEVTGIAFDAESQSGRVELMVKNSGDKTVKDKVRISCVNGDRDIKCDFSKKFAVAHGASEKTSVSFDFKATGEWQVELEVGDSYASRFSLFVPDFFDSSYGAMLPSESDDLDLWQASSGWKIPRGRRLPESKSRKIRIALAANESEAIQLILKPRKQLKGILVKALNFKDGKNVLPAGAVVIDKVGYVRVTHPTDKTGVIADWPDPIEPQLAPCDLKAGLNQPFWIRVSLPKGVKAGEYEGYVLVSGDGIEEKVELEIEVFDFELPDRMSCESAFGMNQNRVFRFHRLKTEEQKREVVDKYLKCLSDYHISPYHPAPLDPWKVNFIGLPAWRGGEYVKENAYKGEWAYMVEDHNENGNVNAGYAEAIKLTGKPLKVCFSHRSDKAQRTLFTMNYYRADGSWISGNNRDMWVESSPEWKREEIIVKKFPKEASAFKLSLWGAGYYEGKSSIGTTWFDDIVITEVDSGKVVFGDGDFESSRLGVLDVEFDWDAWDAQMERAFSEYHFNSFRFKVDGLGGGTFMERYEPQLGGLRESQPGYSVLLEKYLKGAQQHLKEKGWLNDAYIYWFDEPDPKDYEFVMNGFKKLKKYAPGLRRMLTEQVEPGLVGGPNLWCPLTPNLNVDGTEAQRKAGDKFWWYVCCSPKAPYVTLFIDHPGAELRLWLWQTWAERVTGILIWDTVYWHSPAAYPDSLQNPYEDPMGWVNHVDKGVRRPWGNGDGRFMYPPMSVYTKDGPITDGPVPTVRLEMLRDGLEDYEYFVILKKLLAERGSKLSNRKRMKYEALLVVPESVSKTLTDFNTDPAAMEEHREKLARAIEDLSD